jgi:hypothetical protein
MLVELLLLELGNVGRTNVAKTNVVRANVFRTQDVQSNIFRTIFFLTKVAIPLELFKVFFIWVLQFIKKM